MEFAAHEIISKSLGVPVYFADPYSSWQKGAIENANGLVRFSTPKAFTKTFRNFALAFTKQTAGHLTVFNSFRSRCSCLLILHISSM